MIYMGIGGDWSPHAPNIDILIGQRLKARGFAGSRDERGSLFGSQEKVHALEYARDGDEANLRVLEPQAGCVVSWVPGVRDMMLVFGTHLRDLRDRGVGQHGGVKFGTLIRDIAGDIDIAETYLRLGRQKRALGAVVDTLLDTLTVVEQVVGEDTDLDAVLGTHRGEIWITGPCLVHVYDPEFHDEPTVEPEAVGVRP